MSKENSDMFNKTVSMDIVAPIDYCLLIDGKWTYYRLLLL